MKLAPTIELFANYKLDGRTTFQGLPISIENDRGSTRSGVDSDGKPWSVTMTYPYGYIRRTEGVDGDHVDCFIGPNKEAPNVYVIHTVDPKTGKYDEDKCMLGFDSASAAKKAFLENYSSPKFFGSMDTLSFAKFQTKVLATKEHPAKIAAQGLHFALMAGGQGSGCKGPNCGRHPLADAHDAVKNMPGRLRMGEPGTSDDENRRIYQAQKSKLSNLMSLAKDQRTNSTGQRWLAKAQAALNRADKAFASRKYMSVFNEQDAALSFLHSFMSHIGIQAGGAGSGCRGPNCGRKKVRTKNQGLTKKPAAYKQTSKNISIAQQKIDELKKSFAKMPAPKPPSRVQQMTSDTWISKDGTRTRVSQMGDHHLRSVLRQLHEQLALAKGEGRRTGPEYSYETRVGQDGPTIARAIPPYNRLVAEARKRGLHW